MLRRGAALAADSLFALRPLLWIPAVALFEAGRTVAFPFGTRISPPSGAGAFVVGAPVAGALSAELLALLALLGAVHLANAARDRETDLVNRKGRLTASGSVGPARLLVLCAACLIAAFFLALRSAPTARSLLGAAAVLGAAYVVPGIEFKRRAGLDLAANAIGYGGVALFLGASAPGGSLANLSQSALGGALVEWALAAGPYVLGVGSVALCTMAADRGGDEAAGLRTTAVALGEARAGSCAAALAWGSGLWGLFTTDLVPAVWGMLAGAWLSLAGERLSGRDAWNRAAIGLQISFLAILAARSWVPFMFAAFVGTASSLYYFGRFRDAYPAARVGSRGVGAGR